MIAFQLDGQGTGFGKDKLEAQCPLIMAIIHL